MKLVSVNAIVIGSCNISLFVKVYSESGLLPPLTLFMLSFIFINLLLLLEYEHRQFSKTEINIFETNWLFRKYLYLFAGGAVLTFLHKLELEPCNEYLIKYIFLGKSVYYSLLYYFLNFFLGNTYLYLFKKAYFKANRERIPYEVAVSEADMCPICLKDITEGQKIAKISCMHVFHSHCLHKWIKKKQTCPICLSTIQH